MCYLLRFGGEGVGYNCLYHIIASTSPPTHLLPSIHSRLILKHLLQTTPGGAEFVAGVFTGSRVGCSEFGQAGAAPLPGGAALGQAARPALLGPVATSRALVPAALGRALRPRPPQAD